MSKMKAKQKKDLRKRFDDILIELEKADRWSMDTERGERRLHEITGEITITINYYNKKRRRKG